MLRGSLFLLFLSLNTLIIGIILLPLSFHSYLVGRIAYCWTALNIKALHIIGGIKLIIHGQENIPKGQAIIISNHQSTYETFLFKFLLQHVVFILKKELYRIPIFGWYLKQHGMISIDRQAGVAAIRKMKQQSQYYLRYKRKIIIFPQGTRVMPNQHKSFQSGFVSLLQDDVPIIPVALCTGLRWKARSFKLSPGEAHISFMPALSYDYTINKKQ